MRSPCRSKLKFRRHGWTPEIAAPSPCYERLKYGQKAVEVLSGIMLFAPLTLLVVEYFGGDVPFAYDLLVDLIPILLAVLVGARLIRIRNISLDIHGGGSLEINLSRTPADGEIEKK